MRSRSVRSGLAVLLVAVAIPGAPALAEEQDTAPPPHTIPALREWAGDTGSYTLTAASRITVNSGDSPRLMTTAMVFADDVANLTGLRLRRGEQATPRAGDIHLTLRTGDTGLGAEGYKLTVGSVVRLEAGTAAGIFNGTRTLLQWFKQNRTIPGGTARDWPTSSERGLMVDVGRKFFTLDWLKARVKDLAYAKLNYLHLHLSDNLGFRLESARHPEVVSADHYTKRQMAELIAFAARYHVQIVPEIDAPGHMDQILAAHPDLKLVANDGTVSNGYIDLSKPAAYTLIQDLITEYLPLFPSRYWHIGADEYVSGGSGGGTYDKYPQLLAYARAHYGPDATAKDTFYGYVNWANDLVRRHGKTTRMWNDDLRTGDGTVAVNPNIVVEHWYNRAKPPALTPQQLVDRGHRLLNGHYTQTYYVLGSSRKPNLPSMYQSWNVNAFHGGHSLTPATASMNQGAKVHVWCDRPAAETEAQVASNIRSPLRVMAQHTWGTAKPVATWAEYAPIVAAVGAAP